jgi:hypothetical protein
MPELQGLREDVLLLLLLRLHGSRETELNQLARRAVNDRCTVSQLNNLRFL